jgi:hypothetical protein
MLKIKLFTSLQLETNRDGFIGREGVGGGGGGGGGKVTGFQIPYQITISAVIQKK